jgi:hypothetical protein
MEGMSSRGVTSDWNCMLYRNPIITGGQDTHPEGPAFHCALPACHDIVLYHSKELPQLLDINGWI